MWQKVLEFMNRDAKWITVHKVKSFRRKTSIGVDKSGVLVKCTLL